DPFQLLGDPPAAVPAEQSNGANLRPERGRGARGVEPLAARNAHKPGRPVDLARPEASDLEEAVDRRARRDAGDHALASARVGCAAVPPAARMDSAPQALARRSTSSSPRPSRWPARKPASKLSPAPTASTSSTATAGDLTTRPPSTARAPSEPSLTTTRTVPSRESPRAASSKSPAGRIR